MRPPDRTEPDATGLPEPLEQLCYDTLLGAGEEAERRTEQLCADHPEHTTAIRALAAELGFSDRLLNGMLADAGDEAVPARIGNYRIEERIGAGGFGTVYRARQQEPVEREVALKVLRSGALSERAIRRFSVERQALARMQHANIARVFDAGVAPTGHPFLAMELVCGEPITDYCDAHGLGVDARLALVISVCAGVVHAHQRGIVHRDIKPSNVLVVDDHEGPRPMIIDFGLAKAMAHDLGSTATLTIDGGFVGTPAYTSPEQAAGAPVDTRADVHALGLLLFELLTGDLPHGSERLRSSSLTEALRIVREEEPRSASRAVTREAASRRGTTEQRLARRLRGDLDVIVRHALEREPDRRYPSASALLEDVDRHRRGLPIAARRPTFSYVIAKLARRHRTACTLAALLIAAVLLGGAAVVRGSLRLAAAQRDADWNSYAVNITAARLALDAGHGSNAIDLLAATDPVLRGWEHDLLRRAADDALRHWPVPHEVWAIDWVDPDTLVVAYRNGRVELRDATTGEATATITPAADRLTGFAMLGDGSALAVRQEDDANAVQLLDLGGVGRPRTLLQSSRAIDAIAGDQRGRFAAARTDGLWVGAVDPGVSPTRWPSPGNKVTALVFDPHGDSLLAGTQRGDLLTISASGPQRLAPAGVLNTKVSQLAIDTDRQLLLAAGRHRLVALDLASGALRYATPTPGPIVAMQADPRRGVLFAAGGWGRAMVAAWKIETGERLGLFDGHRFGVYAIALSPDGKRLATGGLDDSVRLWDPMPRPDAQTHPLGLDVRDLVTDPDVRHLAYCNMDGETVVRSLPDLEVRMARDSVDENTSGERYALTATHLFVVGWDGVLRKIDPAAGTIDSRRQLVDKGLRVNGVAANSDGSRLVVSSYETNALYLLKSQGLELLWQHDVPEDHERPKEAWFAPDGVHVVCSYYGGEFEVFAPDGRVRARTTLPDTVHDVAWSRSGEDLVLAVGDGTVRVLAWDTLSPRRQFTPHNLAAFTIAVSHDGRRLASWGPGDGVRVHDYATGTPLLTLPTVEPNGHDLCWSADDRQLFGLAQAWDTPCHLILWDAGAAAAR